MLSDQRPPPFKGQCPDRGGTFYEGASLQNSSKHPPVLRIAGLDKSLLPEDCIRPKAQGKVVTSAKKWDIIVGGKFGFGEDLLKEWKRHLVVLPLNQSSKEYQIERQGGRSTKESPDLLHLGKHLGGHQPLAFQELPLALLQLKLGQEGEDRRR